MSKIKIVVKKPNLFPYTDEVEDTLETWQKLVEGHIECVPATNDGSILMIVNEEGKLKNLEPNIFYGEDIILGNAVFVGNDAPEFRSLTPEETKMIMDM